MLLEPFTSVSNVHDGPFTVILLSLSRLFLLATNRCYRFRVHTIASRRPAHYQFSSYIGTHRRSRQHEIQHNIHTPSYGRISLSHPSFLGKHLTHRTTKKATPTFLPTSPSDSVFEAPGVAAFANPIIGWEDSSSTLTCMTDHNKMCLYAADCPAGYQGSEVRQHHEYASYPLPRSCQAAHTAH